MMHVPVDDPEGCGFKKVAIEGWINGNGASPVTRQTVTIDSLYPNHRGWKAISFEFTGGLVTRDYSEISHNKMHSDSH